MKAFLLALLGTFIIMKVLGFVAWSWWLVFTPLYALVGLYFIALVIFFVAAVVAASWDNK